MWKSLNAVQRRGSNRRDLNEIGEDVPFITDPFETFAPLTSHGLHTGLWKSRWARHATMGAQFDAVRCHKPTFFAERKQTNTKDVQSPGCNVSSTALVTKARDHAGLGPSAPWPSDLTSPGHTARLPRALARWRGARGRSVASICWSC